MLRTLVLALTTMYSFKCRVQQISIKINLILNNTLFLMFLKAQTTTTVQFY